MTEERAKIGFPPKTTPYEDWCKIITKLEAQLTEKDKQIEVIAKSKNLVINNQLEEINMLKAQIEKMRDCLKRWYKQKGEKYTDTFYETLMRDTEKHLWTDVGN